MFWKILNFNNRYSVRHHAFFKLMKTLMVNIGKVTDQELLNKIAKLLIEKTRTNANSSVLDKIYDNFHP